MFARNDGYNEKDLIQYGYDHISAAKVLFERSPTFYDSAAYLAHIGVELILKAIHHYYNDEFEGTHNLVTLYDALEKNDIQLKAKDETFLVKLDKWKETCYPNGNNLVALGDEDWKRVESLFNALCNQIPEELKYTEKNIDPTRKGGRVLMGKPKAPSKKTVITKSAY